MRGRFFDANGAIEISGDAGAVRTFIEAFATFVAARPSRFAARRRCVWMSTLEVAAVHRHLSAILEEPGDSYARPDSVPWNAIVALDAVEQHGVGLAALGIDPRGLSRPGVTRLTDSSGHCLRRA